MNTSTQASSSTFHGAALIDSQGREVPITEDMIRKACDSLEAGWQYPDTANLKSAHPKGGTR